MERLAATKCAPVAHNCHPCRSLSVSDRSPHPHSRSRAALLIAAKDGASGWAQRSSGLLTVHSTCSTSSQSVGWSFDFGNPSAGFGANEGDKQQAFWGKRDLFCQNSVILYCARRGACGKVYSLLQTAVERSFVMSHLTSDRFCEAVDKAVYNFGLCQDDQQSIVLLPGLSNARASTSASQTKNKQKGPGPHFSQHARRKPASDLCVHNKSSTAYRGNKRLSTRKSTTSSLTPITT